MPGGRFPRHLIRKLKGKNWPLVSLAAVRDIRTYLREIEREAILTARGLGHSVEDIAESLGVSPERADELVRSVEAGAAETEEEAAHRDETIVIPDLEQKHD